MSEEQSINRIENSHEPTAESTEKYGTVVVPDFLRNTLSPRALKFLENQGCFLTYDRILDLDCKEARFMGNCGSATVEELKKFQEACRRDLDYITEHHVSDDSQSVISDWAIMDLSVTCKHALERLSMPLTVDLFGRLTDDIINALIPKNQAAVNELKVFAAKVVNGEIQPEDLSVCQHLDEALPEGFIAGLSTSINSVLESRHVRTVREFLTLSPSDFGSNKNRIASVQHYRQLLLLGDDHTCHHDTPEKNQLLWAMVDLPTSVQNALKKLCRPLSVEAIKALDREKVSSLLKNKEQICDNMMEFVEKVKRGEFHLGPITDSPYYGQELPKWFNNIPFPEIKKVYADRKVRTFGDYLHLSPWDFGTNKSLLVMIQQCRQTIMDGTFFEIYKDKLDFSPSSCSSFEEFILKGLNLHRIGSSIEQYWEGIIKNRFDFNDNKTLVEFGEAIGLTDAGTLKNQAKTKEIICSDANEPYMQRLVEQLDTLFTTHGCVMTCQNFIEMIETAFGWTNTTCKSISKILQLIGKDLQIIDDCVVWLNEATRARYHSFADYMKNPDINLLDKSYDSFNSDDSPAQLQDLAREEYITFLKMILKDDDSHLQKNEDLLGGLSQLISLVLSNTLDNKTILQQEVIIRVLEAAGLKGLSEGEIIQRCLDLFPQEKITAIQWKRRFSQTLSLKSKNGQRIIGSIHRGVCHGEGTRYVLMKFLDVPENRSVIADALEEINQYMNTTGLGVVRLWGFWKKYQNRFSSDFTFDAFRYLLEYLNHTDMTFQYTYAIHPAVGVLNDKIQPFILWQIYDYFHFYGKDTISYSEISNFAINMLKFEPTQAANVCAGFRKVSGQPKMYHVAPPAGERPAIVYINNNWQYR